MNTNYSTETAEASLKKIATLGDVVRIAMLTAEKEASEIQKAALLSVESEMKQIVIEENALRAWTLGNIHKLGPDLAMCLKNGNVGFTNAAFSYRIKYGASYGKPDNYPCIIPI